MKTQTIPDNSQLQLHNDVVECNSCNKPYAVQVALDMPNVKTKCPWCERVQDYDLQKESILAPSWITPGKEIN
jgi:phage FluMu protein Com